MKSAVWGTASMLLVLMATYAVAAENAAIVLTSPQSVSTPSAASAASAASLVRHDYVLHCAGCHLMDGTGSETVPSLHELGPVMTANGGRDYLMRVPGVAQAPVDDARLARLLDYVLSEFSGLENVEPFSPAEVGLARERPLRDPVGARPVPRAGD
ncbi:MAG: hypothetical protein ACI8TX_000788 [Hyphomicrobiaceae bacterium]|jgi:hypothetical protein